MIPIASHYFIIAVIQWRKRFREADTCLGEDQSLRPDNDKKNTIRQKGHTSGSIKLSRIRIRILFHKQKQL